MNGKYVIFYALILAAMAGLLIVGSFDSRLLNGVEPKQPARPNLEASSPPPVTDPRPRLRPRINDNRRINSNSHNTDPISKTNLYEGSYLQERMTRARLTDRDSDYIVIEDDYADRQLMHRDATMVEDVDLRHPLIGEPNTSHGKTAP